jgi:hypothetical protein
VAAQCGCHSDWGDVLILETEKGVKIYAVGRVTKAGKEDFHGAKPAPLYVVDHAEAVTVAQTVVAPGGFSWC